jgi:hypothetical protein
VVHDAAEAGQALNGRRAALACAAVAAAVIAGCGGGKTNEPPVGAGPVLGAPVRLASCDDWNAGSVNERLGTIAEIENYVGGPVSGTASTGPVLDTQQAYDLFENTCSASFASAFRLYKLYARAAAFTPQ